jgi:predicted ATPase/class 3 adenylate cyclase
MAGESPAVPSGTVTFLFSDVVGSTRLWAHDPSAMSQALRIHDQVFRDAIAAHHGYVFATAGDSFSAAFNRASSAVECATTIQVGLADVDWGDGPALTVRIGIHLGETEERDGNYFGSTLNLAARAMAVAHGGQCVLTEGVRDAAAVKATDLGVHHLRDIEIPVHLYQIGSAEFPPLWSVGTGIVSLPSPRTSLIGREDAIATVRRLIAEAQLVTLTGVGGCGKTRLAIEVATREVPAHHGGVWFVDLAAIADDLAIAGAFATALDVMVNDQATVGEQIAAYLAPRDALLVVDNCEHMIDDVAHLLDHLLAHCPQLRVLATSRESLEIEGEHTWKVPSLATGAKSAAVELFVTRATAAGAIIDLDDAAFAIIGDIVDRLDGMPLAIELAAARARNIALDELRDRLADRFRFLTGGKRRSRQRQATLEAAMQWSYDLLDDAERSMLRCLSVFQGGFALTDVPAIAAVTEPEAVDLVDALSRKSLIDVSRDDRGHIRYRLLETIRMFALSRFVDTDEIVAVRDRHLDHFVNDDIGSTMNSHLDISSTLRADREFDNFRSAATWALERARPDATMLLAAMTAEAFIPRGERNLVLNWLQLSAEVHGREFVFARTMLAYMLQSNGDAEGARRAAREAIAEASAHPCDFVLGAMQMLNAAESVLGNHDDAQRVLAEARTLAQSFGVNVQALAEMSWMESCLERGRIEEALAVAVDIGERAPTFAFGYWVEAMRASLLVVLDRVSEADGVVRSFGEVPPTSQWAHMTDIVRHAVMVHAEGPQAAARSLAAVAREAVARRPELFVDFLQGFAYAAYFLTEYDRAREIAFNTLPLGAGWMQTWIIGQLYGATTDVEQIRRDFDAEHPWSDLHAFTAQHGRRLFTEELARWS